MNASDADKSEGRLVAVAAAAIALFIASHFVGWEVRREEFVVPKDGYVTADNSRKYGPHFEMYKAGDVLDVRVRWELWRGERKKAYGRLRHPKE